MSISLTSSIIIFFTSALTIAIAGTKMSRFANILADKTGLGEALTGSLLLAGSTSLPGIVTSITAAAMGHPQLAISNALGGIAVQTAFLTIADLAYPKANLEHAVASVTNLIQGILLIGLLIIPVLATTVPDLSILEIHPASLLLIVTYIFGLTLIAKAREKPMWKPLKTNLTRLDEPKKHLLNKNQKNSWLLFLFLALLTAIAGYAIAKSGLFIVSQTGISEGIMGGLFIAIFTSLPELVTSVAAVKQGALTMAVSNIIGGNSFDVLFLACADFAYHEGTIYQAFSTSNIFTLALTILMSAVLVLGLLRREKYGFGKIGFESLIIIILYLGGSSLLFFNIK